MQYYLINILVILQAVYLTVSDGLDIPEDLWKGAMRQ